MRLDENGVLQYSQRNRICSDVRKICGSLIRVVEDTIEFAHETVAGHIVKSEGLDRGVLEADLTLYCLSYLCHQCFSDNLGFTDSYVEQGIYAFQDYAISKWDSHLKATIESHGHVFRHDSNGGAYQRQATTALQIFFQTNSNELVARGVNTESENSRVFSECQVVHDLPFHNVLVPIWSHILWHHRRGPQERCQVSLKRLEKAIKSSRKAILDWSSSKTGDPAVVEEFYGKHLYKCERPNCAFFYEGFDSEAALKNHLNRHERPFTCPLESSCSLARFGFATNRDRDRHVRIYHPDDPNSEEASSQTASREGTEQPAEDERTRFKCKQCDRRYTRQVALDAHINSTHLGRRPHECDVCRTAFARKNDLRRHERTKHSRG
jgi:hypothetical protein